MLDARVRDKARSPLDPSDPSDAKAFGPPMSDLDIRCQSFDRCPQSSALRFPKWDLRFRPLDFTLQPSARAPTCASAYRFQICCAMFVSRCGVGARVCVLFRQNKKVLEGDTVHLASELGVRATALGRSAAKLLPRHK